MTVNHLPFPGVLLGLSLCATVACAQDPPTPQPTPQPPPAAPRLGDPAQGPGAPGSREAMWFAPTAEDWKKPVLVQWQRSWDDAVEVSKETGRPILVCVNMDGEIASEHYAGIRYRQPDIARIYEPYVCVIASVYRHNPRDYDEQGRRIPCPRFGCVTCGEHIAIEPKLFDQFFDGKRIAPRHIMVELDGKENYDVYYAFDTASVFQHIVDGVKDRPVKPLPERGDGVLVERVQSRDFRDRLAVEQAYLSGDRAQKQALLQAAFVHANKAPTDVLRLAIYGLDVELGKLARQALAKSDSESAIDLIVDALRVPMDPAERQALIAALVRIGEKSPRSKMLATVQQGLGDAPGTLAVAEWQRTLAAAAPSTAPDAAALESRVQYAETRNRQRRADPGARLELAESTLAFAAERRQQATRQATPGNRTIADKHLQLLYEDAHRLALEAEQLGAKGWRVNAAIAVSAFHLGLPKEAYARAEAAVTGMPADASSPDSMTAVLVFAEARQQAIVDAIRQKQDWPPQWLTDLNAAYSVLARHPLGTDAHVCAHYDFLQAVSAKGESQRVLDQGLQRFSGSWPLHERLRARILAEQGVAGLEPAYEAMLAKPDAPADGEWYAGYTSIVAAECHRRAGDNDKALPAYERAIGHYKKLIERRPETAPNANHYTAIAQAGRARILLEQGQLDGALAELLASFTTRPEAAGTLDGLNLSPSDTSRNLRAALLAAGKEQQVAQLDAALKQIDPELLRLPAYERQAPDAPPAGGNRPRRGRRGGD